jgi:asparagine synthase (glutamine-hydrolysing)
VLSGEGADELFGGYPTYLGHKAAHLFHRFPAPVRALLRGAVRSLPASTGKVTLEFLAKQFVEAAERPLLERHLQWFGALGPDAGGALLEELTTRMAAFPQADPLNLALWLDFVTYLPDNLLVKVDRATMRASIEARSPYLDRELMELVLPAPSRVKVQGWSTKHILKEAARGLVPAAVIRRRKRGLSVPVARWLNTGLAPLADRVLNRSRLGGPRAATLLAEHRAGRANHARKLWPILMAELWAERWNVDLGERA